MDLQYSASEVGIPSVVLETSQARPCRTEACLILCGLGSPSHYLVNGNQWQKDKKGNDLISCRRGAGAGGVWPCSRSWTTAVSDPTRLRGEGSSSSHVTHSYVVGTLCAIPPPTTVCTVHTLPPNLDPCPRFPRAQYGGTGGLSCTHTQLVGLATGHLCPSQAVSLAVTWMDWYPEDWEGRTAGADDRNPAGLKERSTWLAFPEMCLEER